MLFGTNNTERMRIDSSGNVGIGTTSPSEELELASSSPTIRLTDTNDSTYGSVSYNVNALMLNGDNTIRCSTGGSERMRIDASGRVGVGLTDPDEKLEIFGDVKIGQSGGSGVLHFGNASDKTKIIGRDNAHSSLPNTLGIFTDNAERMTFDASGNVGIGTNSPSALLDVSANGSSIMRLSDSSSPATYAEFKQANGILSFNADAGTAQSFSAIKFLVDNSERARIDSSGNLLVGTTNTTIYASGTGGATGVLLDPNGPTAVARDSNTVMYLNRLTSDGEIAVFRKNGSTVGSISTNANSLPSDRNFKRNIQDLTLGLDFVESLNPVTYNFKIDDEGQAVMTGLIAQEVEEALTAAGVEKNSMTLLQHKPTEDASESDYQMDYLKFVPILINSIKEQQTLIESLTARIAALEE
jgi:hypothetical protein